VDAEAELRLRLRVEDLSARYVHCIDDDRLEEWPELFVERGLPLPIVYADSRAMLRDRVAALRQANIYEPQRYRHLVSSLIVDRVDASSAKAVSNFHVVRVMQTGESTLFEERVVVLDSRAIDTLLAIPL